MTDNTKVTTEGTTDIDPLALFEQLTVEGVDKSIESLQEELAEFTAPREKRLDSLKQLRRILLVRSEGLPQRKPRGTRSDKGTSRSKSTDEEDDDNTKSSVAPIASNLNGSNLHRRVVQFLQVSGATKLDSIAAQMGISVNDDLRTCLADTRYFVCGAYNKYSLVRHS